jgi:hypothetical protein
VEDRQNVAHFIQRIVDGSELLHGRKKLAVVACLTISGSVHGAGRQALLTTISLASDVTLRLAPAWWSLVAADVGSTVKGLEAKANQLAGGGFGGLTVGIGLGIVHVAFLS